VYVCFVQNFRRNNNSNKGGVAVEVVVADVCVLVCSLTYHVSKKDAARLNTHLGTFVFRLRFVCLHFVFSHRNIIAPPPGNNLYGHPLLPPITTTRHLFDTHTMCYNANASIVAYCIGLLSSLAMFRLDHPVIATLIGTYSGMQLAEAVVWHSIDTNNRALNQVGTRMILGNLSIHALMTATSAIYFCVWCAHSGRHRHSVDNTVLFVLWAISFMIMMVTISTTRAGAETLPGCQANRSQGQHGTTTIAASDIETTSAPKAETTPLLSFLPRSIARPFACRLDWDTSLVSETTASGLYAAQVLLILFVLSLVYRERAGIVCMCFAYFAILLVGLAFVAWAHHQHKDSETRSRALSMAMSTMWCFGTAVLSPILVGFVWWSRW
jgi:hypothetical protein